MSLHQAPDLDAPAPALITEGMVLLAIDTETGGLDPARHAITQVGVVGLIWREGLLPIRSVFPLSFAVNIIPNARMEVTEEALRVQGHTRESLAARTDAVPEQERDGLMEAR